MNFPYELFILLQRSPGSDLFCQAGAY